MSYSNSKMLDMIFMYGRANKKALEAHRLYGQVFPSRQLRSSAIIGQVYQRLRDTGSFAKCAYDSEQPRSMYT